MTPTDTAFDNAMPLDLNLDLNDTDTSFPVLPAGTYRVSVKAVEQVASKKVVGGFNLKVTFATVNTETTVGGVKAGLTDDQAPGLTFNRWYPLQPSDNANFDFKQGLAELQDATQGTTQGNRPPFNPAAIIGTEVNARLKLRVSDEFGTQNDIGSLSVA